MWQALGMLFLTILQSVCCRAHTQQQLHTIVACSRSLSGQKQTHPQASTCHSPTHPSSHLHTFLTPFAGGHHRRCVWRRLHPPAGRQAVPAALRLRALPADCHNLLPDSSLHRTQRHCAGRSDHHWWVLMLVPNTGPGAQWAGQVGCQRFTCWSAAAFLSVLEEVGGTVQLIPAPSCRRAPHLTSVPLSP